MFNKATPYQAGCSAKMSVMCVSKKSRCSLRCTHQLLSNQHACVACLQSDFQKKLIQDVFPHNSFRMDRDSFVCEARRKWFAEPAGPGSMLSLRDIFMKKQ